MMHDAEKTQNICSLTSQMNGNAFLGENHSTEANSCVQALFSSSAVLFSKFLLQTSPFKCAWGQYLLSRFCLREWGKRGKAETNGYCQREKKHILWRIITCDNYSLPSNNHLLCASVSRDSEIQLAFLSPGHKHQETKMSVTHFVQWYNGSHWAFPLNSRLLSFQKHFPVRPLLSNRSVRSVLGFTQVEGSFITWSPGQSKLPVHALWGKRSLGSVGCPRPPRQLRVEPCRVA